LETREHGTASAAVRRLDFVPFPPKFTILRHRSDCDASDGQGVASIPVSMTRAEVSCKHSRQEVRIAYKMRRRSRESLPAAFGGHFTHWRRSKLATSMVIQFCTYVVISRYTDLTQCPKPILVGYPAIQAHRELPRPEPTTSHAHDSIIHHQWPLPHPPCGSEARSIASS
jgi:hypothetical protein